MVHNKQNALESTTNDKMVKEWRNGNRGTKQIDLGTYDWVGILDIGIRAKVQESREHLCRNEEAMKGG